MTRLSFKSPVLLVVWTCDECQLNLASHMDGLKTTRERQVASTVARKKHEEDGGFDDEVWGLTFKTKKRPQEGWMASISSGSPSS